MSVVAHPLAHDRGDVADQVVAGVVTERVVDRLEAVDVDDHHRALAAVAGAEGDVLVELGAEATAVEQAGERVVIGEVAQLGLGLLGLRKRPGDDLAVLGIELGEHRIDRRIALDWELFAGQLKEGRTFRGGSDRGPGMDPNNGYEFHLRSNANSQRPCPRSGRGTRVVWAHGQPLGSRRPAPTCSSTVRTRSTGTRGARRRWRGRASEDRPILLSVGYSACHWCHVMAHESFEDAETAAYMNEHFVNVKVDREERPDVDALYMEAVQAISGQGGWPMTVFLDPEGVPFYGGTYFPPDEGRGMPSFRMVMEAVVDAFERKRDEIEQRAPRDARPPRRDRPIEPAGEPPEAAMLEEAIERLQAAADRARGGFGGAPKFPPASALELLLARGEREIPELTLDAMLAGGIYDQLGGGFARYSVDAAWLVPHFEKMLYDNALLARAYLHGWQAARPRALPADLRRDARLGAARDARPRGRLLLGPRRRLRGRGGPLLRLDARGDPGGPRRSPRDDANCINFSAQQVEKLMQFYGVSEGGNFEGRNILHLAGGADAAEPEGLAEMRRALYEARAKRVWPGLDDKRLTAWNALMIAALAEAGAVLEREDYLDAARACADFVWSELRDADGQPAAHLQGRPRPPQRLPRGPRLPARGAAHPLRSELRDRWFERARDLADDHARPLRRRRARRLLLHLRRPRIADRPPQGDRRPPDPLRQLGRRLRPAPPRRPDRRAQLRAARPRASSASSPTRPASTPRPSPTCSGRSTSTSPRPRRWR